MICRWTKERMTCKTVSIGTANVLLGLSYIQINFVKSDSYKFLYVFVQLAQSVVFLVYYGSADIRDRKAYTD